MLSLDIARQFCDPDRYPIRVEGKDGKLIVSTTNSYMAVRVTTDEDVEDGLGFINAVNLPPRLMRIAFDKRDGLHQVVFHGEDWSLSVHDELDRRWPEHFDKLFDEEHDETVDADFDSGRWALVVDALSRWGGTVKVGQTDPLKQRRIVATNHNDTLEIIIMPMRVAGR